MERLWSFLRRFSYVTKEMTPAHRVDLLTEALLHFSCKKNQDMDTALRNSIEKATNLAAATKDELSIYIDSLSLSLADANEIVAKHIENLSNDKSKDNPLSPEETYVDLLSKQANIENERASCTDTERRTLHQDHINRIEQDIRKKKANWE
ncbi:uncharacterized protein [Amphiura filiformis]|uniref:uncharacterized protein isoform X2 n=1 Tax=Amphiura filiformis TaxID=82378 RepID=UPI003B20B5DC